jgi:hypothetical protein
MTTFSKTKPKRSLGDLRMAPKSKPNSPDMKGKLKLQLHTLKIFIEQMENQIKDEMDEQLDDQMGELRDDDETDESETTHELVCNLAGWFNGTGSSKFLSVELSPLFVCKKTVRQPKSIGAWLGRD